MGKISKYQILVGIVTLFFIFAIASAFVSPVTFRSGPRVIYSLDQKRNDEEIIKLINDADKYIYFAIYEFTKENIARALIAAKEKGVAVEGILDRENAASAYETSLVAELKDSGIKIETQTQEDGIMHIKAIVTDKAYASGSYNWTSRATNANDEILEIGADENTRLAYENILKKVLEKNGDNVAALTERVGVPKNAGTIDFTGAKDHIGERASVRGKIVKLYQAKSGMIFFDYCKDYKKCSFSAVIFASDAKNFKNISDYQGETIAVTGIIKDYQGTPEIVISSPNQISR